MPLLNSSGFVRESVIDSTIAQVASALEVVWFCNRSSISKNGIFAILGAKVDREIPIVIENCNILATRSLAV